MKIIPLEDKYKYQVIRLLDDNTRYHMSLNKEFTRFVSTEYPDFNDMNSHEVDDSFNHFIIAVEKEEVIGFIMYKDRGDYIAISDFFVNPRTRGKGIGRQLMDYVVKKKFKNKRIELRCLKDNKTAYNFYLKYGFKVIREDKGRMYKIDDYVMSYR